MNFLTVESLIDRELAIVGVTEHFLNSQGACNQGVVGNRGSTRNFPMGADFFGEGAKIRSLGYYKCQKSPKNSFFTFRRGASMLQ